MRLILALLALFVTVTPVQAHYYAWTDDAFNFTMSFPDLWKSQGALPENGRIKVMGPALENGQGGANCTVFATQDKRFLIYPRDYMLDVVAQEINWTYWEQAVSNYNDLYFYYDNYGALGKGDARYTLVDYIDRSEEPGIRKRAWVHASLYGDLHMMVHCSAPIELFDQYANDFGQIVGSIQFEPQYARAYRGLYRDFLRTKEYNMHWHEPIVMLFFPRKMKAKMLNCPLSEDYDACLYKPKPLPIRTR